jgi:hypothetical protein
MIKTGPYDVYTAVIAIRLHFQRGSYDAFKYNFRGRGRRLSDLKTHKDYYFYEKIARKYRNQKDLVGFLVSNYIAGNTWIGNMTDEVYQVWLARLQSLTYNLRKDLTLMQEQTASFNWWLRLTDEHRIPILDICRRGEISVESIIVIDSLVNFLKRIDLSSINDPLNIYEEQIYFLQMYKPFVESNINKTAARKTVINLFTYANK